MTPGGGSEHYVSLTPSAWVRITCTGRPQTKLRKREEYMSASLCLRINASRYSHYTGLCLSASLPPRGPPFLGLLETPQVGVYLVIIPIFQHEHGGREAGSPGELTAGHTDQAKSQWAAGDVAAGISFQSIIPTQQRPDLPLVSQPCVWHVFSTPQWNKKGPSLPEPR